MDDSTKVLSRVLQERFVKVIWTHKIQFCQATIYRKKNKCHNTVLAVLSVSVSASAITNVLKWLPECKRSVEDGLPEQVKYSIKGGR